MIKYFLFLSLTSFFCSECSAGPEDDMPPFPPPKDRPSGPSKTSSATPEGQEEDQWGAASASASGIPQDSIKLPFEQYFSSKIQDKENWGNKELMEKAYNFFLTYMVKSASEDPNNLHIKEILQSLSQLYRKFSTALKDQNKEEIENYSKEIEDQENELKYQGYNFSHILSDVEKRKITKPLKPPPSFSPPLRKPPLPYKEAWNNLPKNVREIVLYAFETRTLLKNDLIKVITELSNLREKLTQINPKDTFSLSAEDKKVISNVLGKAILEPDAPHNFLNLFKERGLTLENQLSKLNPQAADLKEELEKGLEGYHNQIEAFKKLCVKKLKSHQSEIKKLLETAAFLEAKSSSFPTHKLEPLEDESERAEANLKLLKNFLDALTPIITVFKTLLLDANQRFPNDEQAFRKEWVPSLKNPKTPALAPAQSSLQETEEEEDEGPPAETPEN